MTFEYYNPNPLLKKEGDCVVRALCAATGLAWDDVYAKLYVIGFELKEMQNDDNVWKKFLLDHGFSYVPLKAVSGKTRMTVEKFAEKNKRGVYVLRIAHHITTVKDGKYYDLWNCGDKCVYGYYERNK